MELAKLILHSIIYIKLFVGTIVSIALFLPLSSCNGKSQTPASAFKIDCSDSVFYDLKLADQHKDCVKTVNLTEAGFNKLPLNLLDYPNLVVLNLRMNNIDTIPDEICKLTKLNTLILAYCGLKYLPSCIGNLKNLKNLDLLDNDLETLPETIGDIHSLERLNLKGNKIRQLHTCLTQSTSTGIFNVSLKTAIYSYQYF